METAIFVLCILSFMFSFFTFVSTRSMIKAFKLFLDTVLKTMKDAKE